METKDFECAVAYHRQSAFSRRMLERLNEIEVRPVGFGEDREAVYRFRYAAYRAAGHMRANAARLVHDEHDDAPGAMLFALHHRGRMVSSIRFNLVTPDNRTGMSRLAFPDIVEPMLDRGETIIDPTRFAVCPSEGRELPQLSYVTVRLAAMACAHFRTDHAFSLVRPSHAAFYRKVFASEPIGEERPCPGVEFRVCLLTSRMRETYRHVLRRQPFFHSLESERRMLFGPVPAWVRAEMEGRAGPSPVRTLARVAHPSNWLTVLPTARLALTA